MAGEPDEVQARPPRSDFPIVGVGASAGGLDAFRQLLGALPTDTGMAFVLVQHLDPSHESILAELLAKGSRMPVSEVRGDTAVEPDHVYVTPGRNDVAIEGDVLKLVPRVTTGGRHLPIDSFLRTLAEARGSKAVGVILSGTGSDGTLGARAIKAEGGIVFAQDPESAPHDGMPRSAIASGCVDFVLPPTRIAQELSRLSRHPYVITPPRARAGGRAAALVAEGEGRVPRDPGPASPDDRRPTSARTSRRPSSGGSRGAWRSPTSRRWRSTRRYLESHPDEAQALHQECLITVTSFFRDPGTFQVLSREVLPRLLKDRPPGAPVRVWVPGCATGEEVYSIVICLLEAAGEQGTTPSLQVFGTDLSESAVEKARSGRYLPHIAQDVSPARLQRFFTEVDGGYRVIKTIRDMCVFARHDVTRDPPFSRMDLISCRNVLIYLEPRMQQRVMAVFHYALLTSGSLLLGTSETASAAEDLFAPVDKKHRIYLKRPAAAPALFGFGAPRAGGREGQEGRPVAAKPGPREELPREADRILLARYAPAGVIVDEKDDIVEFRGETEPYLEHAQGRASLNLFKMARKGLLLEIRRVIQEARKKDAPVRKEGVSLRHRGHVRRLDLEVVPLRGSPEKGRSLLVLFEARPETRSPSGRRAERRPRVDGAEAKASASLRRELGEATRYLQAVTEQHEAANEELQASNEEVLSANEELQSINEELETAKEELQASNEELATLNQELQGRNLQLERALEYANGIVETVRNPLLILDAGLRVERANRSFYDTFRVTPEETVGRLVYELGEGQWDMPALRQMLDELLRKAGPGRGRRGRARVPAGRASDADRQRAQASSRERPREHPAGLRGPDRGPEDGDRARGAARPGAAGAAAGRGGRSDQGRVHGDPLARAAGAAQRHGGMGAGPGHRWPRRGHPGAREGGHRAERQRADAAHRGPAGLLERRRGQAHPVTAADGPRAGGGRRDRGGPFRGRGQGDPPRAVDGRRGGARPRRSGPAAASPLEPAVERGEVHAAGRAGRGLDRTGRRFASRPGERHRTGHLA